MGAAPSRAGPRSAGRLAHSAGGGHQRGPQGQGQFAAATTSAAWSRENRLGSPGSVAIRGNTVEFRVREGVDQTLALQKLRELSQPLGGVLSTTGQRTVDVVDAGNGLFRLTPTEPAIVERIRQSVEQSIQIVERRVNELGTVEPTIQRQGVDRILVQVPGLQDPSRLKDLLGKTAKLTFRMVDQSVPADQATPGNLPPDSELLKGTKAENNQAYVIEKRVLVSGEDLTDAQPGFDQRTSEPIVTFRFNNNGARRFAQVTQENVGKPFAIVLDNEVISAPVIREPILGGSGQISGQFHCAGRQRPRDPAARRRAAGSADDHRGAHRRPRASGRIRSRRACCASWIGAVAGRAVHVRDLRPVRPVRQYRGRVQRRDDLRRPVAAQRHADAAGHRRHRAHRRHGGRLQRADLRAHPRGGARRAARRSASIDAGFSRALATILDSNITTFIAAAVLFFIGIGSGARFRCDARHRHHHHGVHRIHLDPADGRLLVPAVSVREPCRSDQEVSVRLLRIVPDDTKFDFMRFRRISFPVSAILSVLAIVAYFYVWPEFRHRLRRRHAARGPVQVRSGRSRARCAPR